MIMIFLESFVRTEGWTQVTTPRAPRGEEKLKKVVTEEYSRQSPLTRLSPLSDDEDDDPSRGAHNTLLPQPVGDRITNEATTATGIIDSFASV